MVQNLVTLRIREKENSVVLNVLWILVLQKKTQQERFTEFQRKTPLRQAIKTSPEYKKWRNDILKRDLYKCIKCGSKSQLEIDHIVPYGALFQEYLIIKETSFMFDTANGRTLCKKCHSKTENHGAKSLQDPTYKLIVEIRKKWELNGKKGTLKNYYRLMVEKFITKIKDQIDTHD